MRKGEHMKGEFAKINPAKQIPAMQEVNEKTGQVFTLSESHTIMRYLAVTREVADHWYPSDARKRALVDQYLDMHHNYIRQGIGAYAFKKLFAPFIIGKTYKEEELEYHVLLRVKALRNFEQRLSQFKYLCSDEISIADLSAAMELDQGKFIDLDLSDYPLT